MTAAVFDKKRPESAAPRPGTPKKTDDVRAKKALGQHFLVDLNIARKICDSLSGGTPETPATVLEVGCGDRKSVV